MARVLLMMEIYSMIVYNKVIIIDLLFLLLTGHYSLILIMVCNFVLREIFEIMLKENTRTLFLLSVKLI